MGNSVSGSNSVVGSSPIVVVSPVVAVRVVAVRLMNAGVLSSSDRYDPGGAGVRARGFNGTLSPKLI